MNDETLMLDEDATLALLRAGRTGTEPALTDVTPVALRGGLRMRRRRQAGQIGAGLLATAAAAAAVFAAMPGLNPNGRTDTELAESAPDSAAITEADVRAINLRVLAERLGPDFRVMHDGQDGSAYVAPAPGSPAAKALPDGYTALADVIVGSEMDAPPCKRDPDREGTTTECETRTAADGRAVELESRSGNLAPSTPVETRKLRFMQPDGDVVGMTLLVEPEVVPNLSERVPRTDILAWLRPHEDALIEAATDPRMAPGSIQERAQAAGTAYVGGTPHERNLTVLHSMLGPSFKRIDGRLELLPGSDAAAGLPAGLGAQASVSGFTYTGRAGAAPECDPPICSVRELPGIGTAYLYFTRPKPGQEPVTPAISILFSSADGDRSSVTLDVTGDQANDAAGADDVVNWLRTFEDELIAAVSHPDLEIEPKD